MVMNNIEICSLAVAISLVCLASVVQSKDSCGPYSWGKDFYVAFFGPRNPTKPRYGQVQTDNYEISLSIKSTASGYLHVVSPGLNQSLTYNITKGDSIVNLPSTLLQNYTSAAIQSKGVRLSASVPVALKATVAKVNDRQYRTTIHSFQMLPVPVLFKHYIIGKANVDIHLVALKKSKFSISYTANGKTSVMTGKLEPFDSYLLRDLPDTGIRRISSSKAIAAFLYNSYYTKQIPGRTTGHKFIIPSINYPKYFRPNAKMRISSLQDGTFIRTTLGSETVVMKLDRGKYIESDLKPMVLSSSQPIAVMLSASRYSTPTYITYLPDVSQFAQEYTLDISYPAYVTIITPTAFKKQLLFSESYIPEWVQTEHVVLDGAPYFIATTKLSGSGLHKISMADPIGRFGGFVAVIDGDFIRGLYPLGMPIGGC